MNSFINYPNPSVNGKKVGCGLIFHIH
ncbi:uncharacterized protein METZ01_LOCUS231445 [marine metagenome]|uniref:Uncharacterized protein n=1 Tax=marine metagenome TaxID=408172 RepID=A0A382GWN7_9ZZZZ